MTGLLEHPSYGLDGKDIKFNSIPRDEIYAKFLNEGIIEDLYYTLPFMRSTEAVYINEEYLSKKYNISLEDILFQILLLGIGCGKYVKQH